MLKSMWRSDAHSALLALTLALLSSAPVAALAADDLRGKAEASQTHPGTVAEVFGKHFVLTLENGRRILVEVPRRDVILSPGERLEVTGSDDEGEFEATRLVRSDGSVITEHSNSVNQPEEDKGRREGSPATARVSATAAIAASERAGYPVITELEWEDGAWEVEALNAEGRPAKLRVDATTGEVTPIGK
jgi:uncharacterized membrane protein YkoI